VPEVVAGLLPLAVVVALSPLPIVAVVLMLLTPRAGGAGLGFLAGWVAGIAGVTTAVVLLAGSAGQDGGRPAAIASYVELALGVVLLVLAVRQWRSRPRDGRATVLPAWLAAVDRVTVVRAGALGVLLSAANPKALLVCVAAGLAISGRALSTAHDVVSVAVFTAVAASTVGALVLAHALARTRLDRPLQALRGRLVAHSTVVTVTVAAAIGLVLVGQGASGLA